MRPSQTGPLNVGSFWTMDQANAAETLLKTKFQTEHYILKIFVLTQGITLGNF